MEVTGRIKKIFEEKTFNGGFRKKEIVVTTNEQYPQDLLIEFTQDRIENLKSFNIGDEVKIDINLRGREWIDPEGVAKYFNSIQGWRIEKTSQTGNSPSEYADIPELPVGSKDDYGMGGKKDDAESDDLPF